MIIDDLHWEFDNLRKQRDAAMAEVARANQTIAMINALVVRLRHQCRIADGAAHELLALTEFGDKPCPPHS